MENGDRRHLTNGSSGLAGQARSQLNRMLGVPDGTGGMRLYLESQRDELRRLGYSIASESDCSLIAVRNVWHWDAMATNMTYVVFLRATGTLSRQNIESEYERMLESARELGPLRLPRGFQHGRTVVPVYIADSIEPDAVALLETAQPMRFAEFVFPVGLDRSSGRAHYLRGTSVWGAFYLPKLRFLAHRLVGPQAASESEPVSRLGVVFTVATGLSLLFSCALIVYVFALIAALLAS